jgi:hypothetical protein
MKKNAHNVDRRVNRLNRVHIHFALTPRATPSQASFPFPSATFASFAVKKYTPPLPFLCVLLLERSAHFSPVPGVNFMDVAPPNLLISRFFTPSHANQNNFPARFLFLLFLQTVIKPALYRAFSFCTAKPIIFCTARISPKTPVIPHIPLNSTSPAVRRPTQIVDFTFFTFRFGVSSSRRSLCSALCGLCVTLPFRAAFSYLKYSWMVFTW